MAVSTAVKSSEITSGFRIDSEYYRSEYLSIDHEISTLPMKSIGACARVTDGEHGSVKLTTDGIKYLTAENVRQGYIDTDQVRYVGSDVDRRNARARVREGDVLVSIKGTLGEIGLAENDLLPANMNRDVAIIKIHSNLSGGYLTAFLRSRFGIYQLAREGSGGVQQMITLGRLRNVRVALLSEIQQKEVALLHIKGLERRKESKNLYSEAESLLASKLFLNETKFKQPVCFLSAFSDLEISRRFDAEHYYPAFKAFLDSLPTSVSVSPLSDHLAFCQRGKQPAYASNGLPVINSKHVQANRVLLEDNRLAAPNSDSNLQIRYGDTLLNGTGRGTLGRAAPYLADGSAVPDNHVTILRSDNLDPVYLSLYLNSAAGQMQVEMHQRGTSGQLELYPFDIRKFLIWPASESFQRELRELHDRAATAERESKRLLEQAKQRVEQLIEEAVQE